MHEYVLLLYVCVWWVEGVCMWSVCGGIGVCACVCCACMCGGVEGVGWGGCVYQVMISQLKIIKQHQTATKYIF